MTVTERHSCGYKRQSFSQLSHSQQEDMELSIPSSEVAQKSAMGEEIRLLVEEQQQLAKVDASALGLRKRHHDQLDSVNSLLCQAQMQLSLMGQYQPADEESAAEDDIWSRQVKLQKVSEQQQRSSNPFYQCPATQMKLNTYGNNERIGAIVDHVGEESHRYWMVRMIQNDKKAAVHLPPYTIYTFTYQKMNYRILIGEWQDRSWRRYGFQDCLLICDNVDKLPNRYQLFPIISKLQKDGSYLSADFLCPCNNWIMYVRVNVWPARAKECVLEKKLSWRRCLDNHLQKEGVEPLFKKPPTVAGLSAQVALRLEEKTWLQQDQLLQEHIDSWRLAQDKDIRVLEDQLLSVLSGVITGACGPTTSAVVKK